MCTTIQNNLRVYPCTAQFAATSLAASGRQLIGELALLGRRPHHFAWAGFCAILATASSTISSAAAMATSTARVACAASGIAILLSSALFIHGVDAGASGVRFAFSSDGSCGPTNGGGTCPTGSGCCSQYGWCGKTPAYCGAGCQPSYGDPCSGSVPTSSSSASRTRTATKSSTTTATASSTASSLPAAADPTFSNPGGVVTDGSPVTMTVHSTTP